MKQNEFDSFSEMLAATQRYYGRAPDATVTTIYWNALRALPLVTVRAAMQEHIAHSKFMPQVSDILDALKAQDERPEAEAAWAIVAPTLGNEYVTIVWTEEMASAYGVACHLADDKIAARMAFKESYAAAVRSARDQGKPARWELCLGYDAAGRDGPLLAAVAEGKLLPNAVRPYLINAPAVEDLKRLGTDATVKQIE